MANEPLAALSVTVRADLSQLLRDIQRAPAEAARALTAQEGQINRALEQALAGGTRATEAAQAQRTQSVRQAVAERNRLELEAERQASRLRKLAVTEEQANQREVTRSLGVAQRENFRTEQAASRARVTLMAEERRQRAAADQAITASQRTRVAAEQRQWRDETAFIKQQIAERRDAQKRADADESAAMRRLDDARRTMRGEPTGTARQQARQMIGGAATNAAVTAGGAALLGGFEAVKQAGAFQTTLLDLKSNTAVTPQNLELYRKSILSFANTYGADMKETAMAFQRAENHFFAGRDAVKVVDAAVRSSVYANADPGQTANLLAQQLHGFKLPASQAMPVAAMLHQAAVRGNLTMEDLIQNAGYGINLAGAFSDRPVRTKSGAPAGLDIKDALAMFSALSANGFNPSEAATQVRDTIVHTVSPTPVTLKRLEALRRATGVDLTPDFTLQGLQQKGLHGVLEDIVAATPGHPEIAMQLMGAQRGGVGAGVLAKAMGDFRSIYGDLGAIQTGRMANPITAGLTERTDSFDQQVKIFDNRLRTLGQTIGESLMPPALRLLSWAQRLADALTRFDGATGGKAGAGAVYGGAAIGALGLGVKARNWVRGAAGIGRVAAGAEEGVEAAAAKAGPIERLLSGTANFFARLAGLDMGAGALAVLSRLGIVGAAAGGAGYLIKQDYDAYRETQGLNRRSAASERDLTAGADTRRRIDGQVIQNRTEAARLGTVIQGYKAEIARIQAEGRRTGADGGPVVAQVTARMRAMERDREHLLTDANRMARDAQKLSHPILSGIAAGLDSPQGRATCAVFASHLLEKLGEAVAPSASARGLRDNFVRAGGRPVPLSQAGQGDLIVYHGGRYGAVQPGGQRSGYHVAVSLGGGRIIQSSSGRVGEMGLYDPAHATAYHMGGAAPAGAGAGSPHSADWFDTYTSLTRGGGKEDKRADRVAYANRLAQDRLAGDPADRFSRERAALAAHLETLRHAGVSELTIEATRVQGLKRIHAEEMADLRRHAAAKARLHNQHLNAALTQPLADMRGGIKSGLASAQGIGSSDMLPRQTQAQYDRAFNDALAGALGAAGGSVKAGLGAAQDIGSSEFLPQITPAQVRTTAGAEKRADAFQDSLTRALDQSRLKFDEATGKVDRYQAALTRLGIETKTLTAAQKAQVDQIAGWDAATAKVTRMKETIRTAADTMKGSLSNAFEGLLGKSKNPFGQIASDFSRMVRKMIADWAASKITDKVAGWLDALAGRRAAPGAAKPGAGGLAGLAGAIGGTVGGSAGGALGGLASIVGGGGSASPAGVPAGVTPVWLVGASAQRMAGAGGLTGAAGALGGLAGLIPGGGAVAGILGALGGLFGGGKHGKFLGLFAEGGTLPPNSWGIAGERGPEVIHSGARPLHVVPNGGGASVPAGPVMNFNIEHVHEASDGTSMARMMADVIKHRLRTSYA